MNSLGTADIARAGDPIKSSSRAARSWRWRVVWPVMLAALYCGLVDFDSSNNKARHVEWRLTEDTVAVDSPARVSSNPAGDAYNGAEGGIAFGEHVNALAKAGHLLVLPAGTRVRAGSQSDDRIEVLDGPHAGQVWWRYNGLRTTQMPGSPSNTRRNR